MTIEQYVKQVSLAIALLDLAQEQLEGLYISYEAYEQCEQAELI